ncbi:GntR family transcriptional regulator [Gryllotalpicola ginsengisoli]|uniref:GntR family transcriptional regulator n=1 Tax=Gryllotalpicola ginsengisoli TaxID=444608 RepID=UPI0003B603D0|nr:GntR family transcriptional regulator [Gryllotalpicola ginsengisoli]
MSTRGPGAEHAAASLRSRIIDGELRPGTQLSEEHLSVSLGVSRNTLREAFRLLAHDRLVEHRFNRGVFVRELSAEDVADVFAVRRIVQLAAVQATSPDDPALRDARQACADARAAAARGAWLEVGSANMRFHTALASTLHSERMETLIRSLMAELRLAFHAMDDDLRQFHEPYIARNEALLELLESGDRRRAADALRTYLDSAERQLRGR